MLQVSAGVGESTLMPKRLILILVVSSLALLAVLVGGVYSLVLFLESVTMSVVFDARSIRIALSSVFVLGAILVYVLKKSRAQFAYGLLEIAVGLVANWNSLGSWSHAAGGAGLGNILYARLAVIAGGIYLMSRGVSNAIEGFNRLLPIAWDKTFDLAKNAWTEGYNKDPQVPIPTILLKRQMVVVRKELAACEEELTVAIREGRDVTQLTTQKTELEEELSVVEELYEERIRKTG